MNNSIRSFFPKIMYILFLFILIEGASFASYKLLKDRILFTEKFKIPKYNIESFKKYYDSVLGWNELGERERPLKTSEISCFGDSFTYGDEVTEAESWPYLLGQKTTKVVSNYGVRGFATDQAIIKLENIIEKDHSKYYLLSFISDNISRNLIVYKPFFAIRLKYHFTKPRYIKSKNKFKLLSNPIPTVGDVKNLRDEKFIEKMGANDFWYQHQSPLPSTFPYSKLLFSYDYWKKISQIVKNPKNPLIKFNLDVTDVWKIPEALGLQDFLVNKFFKSTKKFNKIGILIHYPIKSEVQDYQKFGKIPISVSYTINFCERNNYKCFFPLLEIKKFKSINPDSLYRKSHFSPRGNQLIADYLTIKLDML